MPAAASHCLASAVVAAAGKWRGRVRGVLTVTGNIRSKRGRDGGTEPICQGRRTGAGQQPGVPYVDKLFKQEAALNRP